MAAGTALTAVEDDDGSDDPTNGRLPKCGARDGPEVGDEIGVCNVIEGSLPLDLAFGGKGVLWPEITGLGAGGVGVGQPSILGLGTGGTTTLSTPLGVSKERGTGDLLRLLSAVQRVLQSSNGIRSGRLEGSSYGFDVKVRQEWLPPLPDESSGRDCGQSLSDGFP